MKYSNKVNKIVYGGDYNPEQWPKEVWKEDMKLLKEAHIDVLTFERVCLGISAAIGRRI